MANILVLLSVYRSVSLPLRNSVKATSGRLGYGYKNIITHVYNADIGSDSQREIYHNNYNEDGSRVAVKERNKKKGGGE